jgi:SAM-dependent methyltransferase
VVALAFLSSGFAALVYQVAWQRLLALSTGVGPYSIAVIVTAFMAGLGAGSHVGGVMSARLSPARALLGFALVELGIGLFGVASGPLYYDVLYVRAGWLYDRPWRASLFHLASLALPTLLMGMSLPLLVRAAVRNAATAPRTIALLYGVNVVGAGLGALATPWLLLRHLGLPGALRWAALLNALAGVLALVAARGGLAGSDPAGETSRAEPASEPRLPFGAWLALYALSGFCALALEMLWFRIVDLGVKSTAFTFGTALSVYLLGLAAGSLAGAWRAGFPERPLKAFLLLQCAIAGLSGVLLALLVRAPVELPLYAELVGHWRSHEPAVIGGALGPRALLGLYLGIPAFLCGVPTFLMGLSFTALQRAVQDSPGTSGLKVGLLQAANIAGCALGSLGVGLLALERLGTAGTFRLVVALGLAFALLGLRLFEARRAFALAAFALLLVQLALPGREELWRRLHGLDQEEGLFDEDATSVSALTEAGGTMWNVWVNGKTQSFIPYEGDHTLLGALPALVHPSPLEVAVIGLGSGNTAWAAGCREETRSVTVFEIAAGQERLLRRLLERPGQAQLGRFLSDPRVSLVVADGRNALERGSRAYDFIEADALRPSSAYSGNLYSLEFFRGCARRLKPGGLMCSWAPTPRVAATFREAFPHVLQFNNGAFLIGSNDPLRADKEAWRERVASPRVEGYLGRRLAHQLRAALLTAAPLHAGPPLLPNRDLYPRDEFRTP